MQRTKLLVAPVQGHTDAAWRHFHAEVYGAALTCFTPFMRSEHGAVRPQDLRDFRSPLGEGLDTVPQVIFRDMEELKVLLAALSDAGARHVNLNMGCPFPLQTGKGRGAGFLGNVGEASKLPGVLAKYPGMEFSVKMRLGFESPDEWRGVMPVLNTLDLQHVTVHPRVARQQYGGDLHLDQFEAILTESRNPVIFNGDILTPADVSGILAKYPQAAGVMSARGLLGRPSLAAEVLDGIVWTEDLRRRKMIDFHDRLYDHYRATLCGDAQVLSKIKPFWEYAESEIGRKPWKALRKATTLPKYTTALAML